MDINYSRLITLPTSDYEQITVLYLKPKFPTDTVSYFVECRNILKGIKSVSVDASGLPVSNIIFDGTFSSDGTISPTSTGTVYSFTISGGADNTSYPVSAVVQDLEGNTITNKFILYVSSNQVIASNPPLVLGPAGQTGQSAFDIAVTNGFSGTETDWLLSLQGKTGSTGPEGTSITSLKVNSDMTLTLSMSDGSTITSKATGIYKDINGFLNSTDQWSSVPSDFILNGNIYTVPDSYITNNVKLPSGLYLNENSNIVMTDGSIYYINTQNNSGVLCAAQ